MGFSTRSLFDIPVLDREGETFTAGLPDDRSFVNLWARDGSFAGSVPRISRIDILDRDAILEAAGEVGRQRETQFAQARELRNDEGLQIIRDKLFNQATLPSLAPAVRNAEAKEFADRPQMLRRRERTLSGVRAAPKPSPAQPITDAQAERFARQATIARQNGEDDIF